jgi:preprotein translocase subunit SecB
MYSLFNEIFSVENKNLDLHVQFIKDLSFENPNPLKSFATQAEEQPEISVNVQASAENLGERNFEVTLNVLIEAKQKEEAMFILELAYTAIATVGENVAEEDIQEVVMIDVPHLIFPYARNIISDTIRDGGFPPLHLNPMDFRELYEEQKNRQKDENEEDLGDDLDDDSPDTSKQVH